MADNNPALRLGQTVQTQDGRQGVVRYIGGLHIASGDWVGLELPDKSGKNDGSVKGQRYFSCTQGYGIFVRKESVVVAGRQSVSSHSGGTRSAAAAAANGLSTAKQPRPSAVSANVSAADARKRQSLMSAAARGATVTASSRLSTAASSAASTPRTSTPVTATTARTSDSSAKSRLSTAGPAAAGGTRTSMAPPASPAKTASFTTARPSIGGARSRDSTVSPVKQPRPPILKPSSRASSRLSSRPSSRPPVVATPLVDEAKADAEADVDEDANAETEEAEKEQGQEQEQEQEREQEQHSEDKSPDIAEVRPPSTVESRTADRREVETLKAKIRTLEKKALESRDRLNAVDSLQAEKDRFGAIIQTLQKKLKSNSEEMASLKAKYDDAEKRANQAAAATEPSAEWESQLELANLDREMAEEKAALNEAELEALKTRHEELELEVEILREENKELTGTMSPEERSSAGWLQLEMETERLRQALLLLRDHSHELEADLRAQIKELEHNLDESDKVASKYNETAEKLSRMEEANRHLIEQLDTAEASDDIVIALQAERDQRDAVIEQLQKQIQDYEEHIQVADELELFHVDEEKKLHHALDESEAIITEQDRRAREQDKAIEDLEYTLTKFRDVVHGLQTDIDTMRRDRDISELQAHEMSSKSKAMMDLNLRLQTSATKTQLKTIDYEISRMDADQALTQLDIVERFANDGYDRMPVLALLCFKRIKSKAILVKSVLAERMRERPHLAQDDPFAVYEAMEKMSAVALCCDRFVAFLETSSCAEFTRFTGASVELEPVERSVTAWIEALKRDELGPHPPEYLQRMVGILQDLADKLIVDGGNEAKATELISHSALLESGMESTASQLGSIVKAVQARFGPPKDDDEQSLVFDKQMAHSATKARTVKYLAGKVLQQLSELRAGSVCLGEGSWIAFEEASKSAQQLASFVRSLGKAVLNNMANHESSTTSYSAVTALMTATAQAELPQNSTRTHATSPVVGDEDVFALLSAQLQALQTNVEDLQLKASDVKSCTEFEGKPAPWIARAKEVKAKKALDQDLAEEVAKLKRQAQEQILGLAEKDRLIEEQEIKIDVLESRQRDSKGSETESRLLKDRLVALQAERDELEAKQLETERRLDEVTKQQESDKAELERIKGAIANGSVRVGDYATTGSSGAKVDERSADATAMVASSATATAALKVQVDMLNSEIISLQSAVRHLKQENYALRVPVGQAALREERNAWLDPSNLPYGRPRRRPERLTTRTEEANDLLNGLIDLAMAVEPAKVVNPERIQQQQGKSKIQAVNAARWKTVRQREEVERWLMWKQDVIRSTRGATRSATRGATRGTTTAAGVSISVPLKKDELAAEVAIVPSSP